MLGRELDARRRSDHYYHRVGVANRHDDHRRTRPRCGEVLRLGFMPRRSTIGVRSILVNALAGCDLPPEQHELRLALEVREGGGWRATRVVGGPTRSRRRTIVRRFAELVRAVARTPQMLCARCLLASARSTSDRRCTDAGSGASANGSSAGNACAAVMTKPGYEHLWRHRYPAYRAHLDRRWRGSAASGSTDSRRYRDLPTIRRYLHPDMAALTEDGSMLPGTHCSQLHVVGNERTLPVEVGSSPVGPQREPAVVTYPCSGSDGFVLVSVSLDMFGPGAITESIPSRTSRRTSAIRILVRGNRSGQGWAPGADVGQFGVGGDDCLEPERAERPLLLSRSSPRHEDAPAGHRHRSAHTRTCARRRPRRAGSRRWRRAVRGRRYMPSLLEFRLSVPASGDAPRPAGGGRELAEVKLPQLIRRHLRGRTQPCDGGRADGVRIAMRCWIVG